jgi:hypothetical protein
VHVFRGVDGAVHQAVHRRADDVPALPQNVERDDDGKRRIEDLPTLAGSIAPLPP